jgi:hypothetical protein
MTAPLLSPGIVGQLRKIAQRGLQTEITIERRSVTYSGVTVGDDDYGDDDLTFSETTESRRTGVKGWFHSTPTPMQTEESGALVTVNTYRLFVPVGTDINIGDWVYVGDSDAYVVSDTTAESTWTAVITCSLRKRD